MKIGFEIPPLFVVVEAVDGCDVGTFCCCWDFVDWRQFGHDDSLLSGRNEEEEVED